MPPEPPPRLEIPDDDGAGFDPAAEQAAQDSAQATPEDFRPLTIIILGIVCKIAKGDEPTEAEIDLVNPPLVTVANKYNMSSRWTAEIALFGALCIVVMHSRRRAAVIAARNPQPEPPRDRAEDPLNLHTFTMPPEDDAQ